MVRVWWNKNVLERLLQLVLPLWQLCFTTSRHGRYRGEERLVGLCRRRNGHGVQRNCQSSDGSRSWDLHREGTCSQSAKSDHRWIKIGLVQPNPSMAILIQEKLIQWLDCWKTFFQLAHAVPTVNIQWDKAEDSSIHLACVEGEIHWLIIKERSIYGQPNTATKTQEERDLVKRPLCPFYDNVNTFYHYGNTEIQSLFPSLTFFCSDNSTRIISVGLDLPHCPQ